MGHRACKGQVVFFRSRLWAPLHTHNTHLFVPETHLAGQLIVVFGSSPSGRHHTGLKKITDIFFFHFNFNFLLITWYRSKYMRAPWVAWANQT